MYCTVNFKTKKALKQAVAEGQNVGVYQYGGMFPTDDSDGWKAVEGQWYPKPHTWYAQVLLKDKRIVKVK